MVRISFLNGFSWFCQKFIFFQNTKISDISPQIIHFKNLDDSVVIFQALQTSAASLTSAASATSLASTASKAYFPQKTSWSWWFDHLWHQNNQCWYLFVEWIIKIQFFTNIWHSFWQRPLRPCEVKKVSNSGSGINFHYSGTHWASVFGKFVKTSGQARSLLCVNS